jgi:hypothetical protein
LSLLLLGCGTGGAAAGASFAPTDLSGLIGWFKADSLALSNGAAVATWTDLAPAPHDLSQATGANQPTYNTNQINGLPAVTFDGTNDSLASAAWASPTAGGTIFAVANVALVDGASHMLALHAATANYTTPWCRMMLRVNSANHLEGIWNAASVVTWAVSESGTATTGWQRITLTYDQSNVNMLRGDTNVGTKAATGALTSSTQPFLLGSNNVPTTPTELFNGKIAEVIYYNRGLNSTELASVRSYLLGKYGV